MKKSKTLLFMFTVFLVFGGCGKSSTNEDQLPPETETNPLSFYINPHDTRIFKIKASDGRSFLFLGEKDANGIPTSVSQVIIFPSNNQENDKLTYFYENGRPIKAVKGSGEYATIDWISEKSAMVTIADANENLYSFPLEYNQIQNSSGKPLEFENPNSSKRTGFPLSSGKKIEPPTHFTAMTTPDRSYPQSLDYVTGRISVKCGIEYVDDAILTGNYLYGGNSSPVYLTFKKIAYGIYEYKIPMQKGSSWDSISTNFCAAIDRIYSLWTNNKWLFGVAACTAAIIQPELIPVLLPLCQVLVTPGFQDIFDALVPNPCAEAKNIIDRYISDTTSVTLNIFVSKMGNIKTFSYPGLTYETVSQEKEIDLQNNPGFCSAWDVRGTWRISELGNSYTCTFAGEKNSGNFTLIGNSGTYTGKYTAIYDKIVFFTDNIFSLDCAQWRLINNYRGVFSGTDSMGGTGQYSVSFLFCDCPGGCEGCRIPTNWSAYRN